MIGYVLRRRDQFFASYEQNNTHTSVMTLGYVASYDILKPKYLYRSSISRQFASFKLSG